MGGSFHSLTWISLKISTSNPPENPRSAFSSLLRGVSTDTPSACYSRSIEQFRFVSAHDLVKFQWFRRLEVSRKKVVYCTIFRCISKFVKLAYVLSFSYLSKLLSTVLLFAVHSMLCVSQKLTSPLKMGRPERISYLPTLDFQWQTVSISEGTTPKSINDYTGWIFTQ